MHFVTVFLLSLFALTPFNVTADEMVIEAVSSTVPLHVTADLLEIDPDAGLAVFEGSVAVSYTNLSLTSDRLNIVYGGKGEGDSEISRIVAFGHVTLIEGNATVTANEAVYAPQNSIVTLKGDVALLRDGSILKGESLTYNTQTKNMKLHAAPADGRVKASFSLGRKNK